MLTENSMVSIWSALFGGGASYLIFGSGYYEIPYIEWNVPNYLIYGGMIGLSSFLLKSTGDFILPLISNNTQFNSLSKITIPVSVGLLSVATLFVINGFEIPSIDAMMRMIVLSGGSYVLADWTYNKLWNSFNTSNSSTGIPPSTPIVNVPKNVINPVTSMYPPFGMNPILF